MTGSIIRRFRSQKQLLTRLGLSIQMVLKHGISTQKKDLNVSRFLWIKRPNANGPKIRKNRPISGAKVRVVAGQQIGRTGKTGTNGSHLHFEVRLGDRQVLDPYGCTTAVAAVDPPACVGNYG